MACDEALAERIRQALAGRRDVTEKRMFGGIAFMVRGHMSLGVVHRDLMVRVGPVRYLTALAEPHTRRMDFTGTPLTGMIYVGPKGTGTDAGLTRWLDVALAFVETLPPKKARTTKKAGAEGTRAASSRDGRETAAGATKRRPEAAAAREALATALAARSRAGGGQSLNLAGTRRSTSGAKRARRGTKPRRR